MGRAMGRAMGQLQGPPRYGKACATALGRHRDVECPMTLNEAVPTADGLLAQVEEAARGGDEQTASALCLLGLQDHPQVRDAHQRPMFLARYLQLLLAGCEHERAAAFITDASPGQVPSWWRLMLARDAATRGRIPQAVEEYHYINTLDPKAAEPFDVLRWLAMRHGSAEAADGLLALSGGAGGLAPDALADLAWLFHRKGEAGRAASFHQAAHPRSCRIIQTCDSHAYFDLAMATMTANRRFAALCGADYEMFVGVNRGFHPWHATFNRIDWLRQILSCGHYGWVLYLDADAYVADLSFDLWGFLEERREHAFIAVSGTDSGVPWDINIGVLFVNLADPRARRALELWHESFATLLPPSVMMAANVPFDGKVHNDQSILQGILRENPELAAGVCIEDKRLINSSFARYIRQHLRQENQSFDERVAGVRVGVARALATDPQCSNLLPDASP